MILILTMILLLTICFYFFWTILHFQGTLVLTENGELTPVVRHSNFRLFAAMNPATDVGKRDLPPMLRTRFTELYVAELTNTHDLECVCKRYLEGVEKPPIDQIVTFYARARQMSNTCLFDGAGRSPQYSLRTLCRALEATRIFHDRRYVKSVFIVHVGGTRCVTSRTDNIMKIHSRITLKVEFIRGYIFICLFYV
jgi:hypothetical protein